MAEKRECPECGNMVPVRKDGNLRIHKNHGELCSGGGAAGETPRRSGESIEDKALRYIREGRVSIVGVFPSGNIRAFVRGSEMYEVKCANGAWSCPCPAQTWRCSHVVAVRLVTDPDDAAKDDQKATDPELDELLGDRFAQRPVREEIEA